MMDPSGWTELREAVLTAHALGQMSRRRISAEDVRGVLLAPQAVLPIRKGRVVVQGPAASGGKDYLLRVFVDVDRRPPEIVTAYRTGKIDKYRSKP